MTGAMTSVKQECIHYWIITSPISGILHHRCIHCLAEFDMPEYDEDKHLKHGQLRARRNGSKPPRYWEGLKPKILKYLARYGVEKTLAKFGIPPGTWSTLRTRWRLNKSKPIGLIVGGN